MQQGLVRFVLRRVLVAGLMVLLVSSAALLLVRLAPGDHLTGFEVSAEAVAAERARLGLNRPFVSQYADWLARAVRLDFGESLKYRRPVRELIGERAGNTALLGLSALVIATLLGIPGGVLTGSSEGPGAWLAGGLSIVLLSLPPLVISLVLLLIASTTRWFPVGGFGALPAQDVGDTVRYLLLPSLALALPMSAALERLQSQAMREALAEPTVLNARARGCSTARVVWRHAFRLSLKPVLALYGVFVGTVLSGSFVVEIVMSWPGLGALMYEALVARDLYLVAGCAATGAVFLGAGILASDVALVMADPRVADGR